MKSITVYQGAHVARCILNALSSRPISRSNQSFLVSGLRALEAIANQIEANHDALSKEQQQPCLELVRQLRETIAEPRRERLLRAKVFIERFPPYSEVQRRHYSFDVQGSPPLFRRQFFRMMIMIGPGIGIGDEIQFVQFFKSLCSDLEISSVGTSVYTFNPFLWSVVDKEFEIRDLTCAPLSFFSDLENELENKGLGGTLICFANFMCQEMLRCFAAYEDGINCVEVALASGQAWLQLSGTPPRATRRVADASNPNLSRALQELYSHLTGARWRCNQSRSVRSMRASCGSEFRLLLNPFTSKASSITPEDWVGFVFSVARNLPRGKKLRAEVLPGVTPWCRSYARKIFRAFQEKGGGDVELRILAGDLDGMSEPDEAMSLVHEALVRADLLIGVDTYSAHLAARTETTSIALCFERNVGFWEPAVFTHWFDIRCGLQKVSAIQGLIVRLMTSNIKVGGELFWFVEACKRLVSLGHPLDSRLIESRDSLRMFRRRARSAWAAAPKMIRDLLIELDAEYCWPIINKDLQSDDPGRLARAAGKMADSSFFRIACLAGTTAKDETGGAHA